MEKKVKAYVQITRPFVKWLLPILSVFSGAIMALGRLPVGQEWVLVLLALIAFGPLVQGISIRSVNDLFDHKIDKENQENDQFREFRPLVKGVLTKHEVATFAFFGHMVAVLVAFLFLNKVAGIVLVLTLIGSWVYSAPPFRFRRYFWIQNALIGLFYCVGFHFAGWSLFADWTSAPFAIYPLVFAAGFIGSISKDFSDVEADRKNGVRTLPILIGPKKAAIFLKISYSITFLLLGAVASLLNYPQNAVLISIFFAVPSYLVGNEMEKRWKENGQQLMAVIILIYLAWALSFALAYSKVI